MSFSAAERLARVLLYEGYVLYPYRGDSLKNVKRWAFGTLYPPAFCREPNDRHEVRTELVLRGGCETNLRVAVRFLHPTARFDAPGAPPWFEAVERTFEASVRAGEIHREKKNIAIDVAGSSWAEDGVTRQQSSLIGRVAISATALGAELHRIRIDVANLAALADDDRDAAYRVSLASTHVLVGAEGGELVSALEPPAELEEHTGGCRNDGLFPVLVGAAGSGSAVLASPIILYDYPKIAPESPGDFYDATEIDEMLSLRVQTLTDEEKRVARATDPRARAIIDRSDAATPGELLALHGTQRAPVFSVGDHVRLRPKPGGEALDVVLAGEAATICAIEEDLEGRVLFAVTVDADPGKDLGVEGQPGHRFFFRSDELERAS